MAGGIQKVELAISISFVRPRFLVGLCLWSHDVLCSWVSIHRLWSHRWLPVSRGQVHASQLHPIDKVRKGTSHAVSCRVEKYSSADTCLV